MKKLIWSLIVLAALVQPVWAAERAGEVVSRVGAPEVKRNNAWGPLAMGDAIEVGDRIRTGTGRVKVLLLDDTVLTLDTGHSPFIEKPDAFMAMFTRRIS